MACATRDRASAHEGPRMLAMKLKKKFTTPVNETDGPLLSRTFCQTLRCPLTTLNLRLEGGCSTFHGGCFARKRLSIS